MNLMVVKTAFKFVSTIGVGVIVENAIAMNTPYRLSLVRKGLVSVGTLVLSGMVADQAGKFIDEKYDEFAMTLYKITHPEKKDVI